MQWLSNGLTQLENEMANYILKNKKVIQCDDLQEWGEWYGNNSRRVADIEKNGVRVSTVFLGIDYPCDGGKPLLFETMIFGGEHDQEMWRCSTYEEAEQGHMAACKFVGIDY